LTRLGQGEIEGNSSPREPRPAAVTFVTTEHFVLQGARAATVSEANGRASVFLGAVSGGLIALGFIGQASHLGVAFDAFGLVLLPTLAFLGLTTFRRAFQTGLDDAESAARIARLRAFYFDAAPEVEPYLLSVPPQQRLEAQGIRESRVQAFFSMPGTLAVITAVLTGATVGMLVAVASSHEAAAAFPAGGLAALLTLALMMRWLNREIAAARGRLMPSLGAELGSRVAPP
jgi:hypothetical protein